MDFFSNLQQNGLGGHRVRHDEGRPRFVVLMRVAWAVRNRAVLIRTVGLRCPNHTAEFSKSPGAICHLLQEILGYVWAIVLVENVDGLTRRNIDMRTEVADLWCLGGFTRNSLGPVREAHRKFRGSRPTEFVVRLLGALPVRRLNLMVQLGQDDITVVTKDLGRPVHDTQPGPGGHAPEHPVPRLRPLLVLHVPGLRPQLLHAVPCLD
mmetsp:Transcript_75286/g.201059  ORF Transcript_75286/g.201059 Transcript_75286/m.201059 type:complete len:208 (+) Transcript_75286:291-914(+)